jgi:SAM-dependent methyltransferase
MKNLVNWVLSAGGPAAAEGGRKRPIIRYEADLRRLPQSLVDTFVLMQQDADTRTWLETAKHPSTWRGVLADCLRPYMSRTTANGIAGRGGMFIFSRDQIEELLFGKDGTTTTTSSPSVPAGAGAEEGLSTSSSSPLLLRSKGKKLESLIDIGAGDGGITKILAPYFNSVHVTEDSIAMRWRLARMGYKVLPVNDPIPENSYDVVSCLNVLDRADRPLSLLKALRDATVRPDGVVLLAVVLPWCPFVENGNRQKVPEELLPMGGGECCKGATFEVSLEKLVTNVIEPAGFSVVRWTKLPYLCEGSPTHEYYKLDDAVFVLKRRE